MIVDGHVTLGTGRDATLECDELLRAMDRHGLDGALVAPAEPYVAVRNREGSDMLAAAAREAAGRLGWYACASPWRGREALSILAHAAKLGACALKLDPTLQGFDLLDGLADPLVAFAIDRDWPIYCRTGTPAHALPLQLAELAARHPDGRFIMGRNGVTDFWLDATPALRRAPNLYADTAYAFVDDPLEPWIADDGVGARRIVFTSDAPYSSLELEIDKFAQLRATPQARERILVGNLLSLVNWAPP